MSEETVYVAPGSNSRNVYHTDEGCGFGPDDPLEWSADRAERAGLDECQLCAGTRETRGGDPKTVLERRDVEVSGHDRR